VDTARALLVALMVSATAAAPVARADDVHATANVTKSQIIRRLQNVPTAPAGDGYNHGFPQSAEGPGDGRVSARSVREFRELESRERRKLAAQVINQRTLLFFVPLQQDACEFPERQVFRRSPIIVIDVPV
jgi:hypothetical protein